MSNYHRYLTLLHCTVLYCTNDCTMYTTTNYIKSLLCFEEGRVKVGPGLTEKNFVKTQKSLEIGCNKTCGWVVVVLGGGWIGGGGGLGGSVRLSLC